MWWEYYDDPYLAEMAKSGDQEMLRNINSPQTTHRQAALRLAAYRASQARRRGNAQDAERLEDIIIRRYRMEKDPAVRLMIIRIVAPACGRGSTHMVRFLRSRIAAGDYPGHAALALADLHPRGVVNDIIPLTRHPAPEVRYQAALALSVLGDPAGFQAVRRIWKSMASANWPAKVDGIPLEEARLDIERQALRGFGQRLY